MFLFWPLGQGASCCPYLGLLHPECQAVMAWCKPQKHLQFPLSLMEYVVLADDEIHALCCLSGREGAHSHQHESLGYLSFFNVLHSHSYQKSCLMALSQNLPRQSMQRQSWGLVTVNTAQAAEFHGTGWNFFIGAFTFPVILVFPFM